MKSFLHFITETATQQATRLGLEGDGHGGWYKDGEFVAKTEKGRLKFYNKRQSVGGKDPKQSEKEKNLSSPNTTWGYQGAPNKGIVENKDITEEMVREDYRRFTDKFLSVPLSSVFNYYAAKQTYYIQIGGYGMYYMAENPANLPIPKLNGATNLRIRLKRRGSTPIYNYGFVTALVFTQKPSKSKFDIDTDMKFLAA